jgi:hypothetical protein
LLPVTEALHVLALGSVASAKTYEVKGGFPMQGSAMPMHGIAEVK